MFCQKCGHKLEENAKFCTECGTAVARNEKASDLSVAEQKPVQKKKLSVKKMVALFVTLGVLSLLLFLGAIVGLVVSMLNAEKDTEQYRFAEGYLLQSQEFKALGAEDDALQLVGFSSGTVNARGERVQYAVYRFVVKGEDRDFEIFVVKGESGEWRVADFGYED